MGEDRYCARGWRQPCSWVGAAAVISSLTLGIVMLPGDAITFIGHTDRVMSVAFSMDGKLLVSGSWDTTIKLWDVQKGKEIATLVPPEGRYLGPEQAKGTIYDPVFGVPPPHLNSLACSSDGKTLVSGAADRSVRIWNIFRRKQELKIELEYENPVYKIGNDVFGVAVGPDGKLVASASCDKVVRLWSAASGKLLRDCRGHSGIVYAVTFSPDGKTLASCGYDQTIRCWDVATGKPIRILKGHNMPIRSVAFSPDGRYLASGGGDLARGSPETELKLWEINSGKEVNNLRGHTEPVYSVAFSPSGKILVSAGGDEYNKVGEMILWDVVRCKEVARLNGHKNLVHSIAFSPDGKRLASGSSDKTVKTWDVSKWVGP